MYSLTSPYGHLYNTDTSLLRTKCLASQKYQKSYIPYLYNTDTSVKRTLNSVPLVSVLKRFDCNSKFCPFFSGQRWPSHLTVCGCWLRSTCRQQQCYTSWHLRYCDTLHRRLSWLPQLPMIKRSERNTWIR